MKTETTPGLPAGSGAGYGQEETGVFFMVN